MDIDALLSRVYRGHCWIKTQAGPRMLREPLDDDKVKAHLARLNAYGVCPVAPGTSTTRVAVLDFDSHRGETPWEEMLDIAREVIAAGKLTGLVPIPFRSSGGHGIHLYFIWDDPQDCHSVRAALTGVLAASSLKPGTGGVAKKQVEIFPKQDSVPPDGFGSMFILPYAGESEALNSKGWPVSAPVAVITPAPKPAAPAAAPVELAQFKAALDAIPNDDLTFAYLGYDDWRNIIFAIHHATDGSDYGLALAHEFSKRSKKYDPDFLDNRVWPHIRRDRPAAITARTVFMHARKHGWTEDVSGDFEVLTPAAPAADDKQPARFTVVPVAEFGALPPPAWLVDEVLPERGFAMLYGESGSGKSFMALDMVAAVAQGVPWRAHATRRGNVVYVAAEGSTGFRMRVKAYAHHHNVALDKMPLGVIPEAPNFLEISDTKDVIRAVRAFGGCDVLVIDTLAATTPGANENASDDMGRVIYHAQQLIRALGCAVVMVHHSGKDAAKGARGHSSLRGAVDTELEVSRVGDDSRMLRVTKQKDGEDGQQYAFTLKVVPAAFRDDGETVTSCVIDHKGGATTKMPVGPTGPRGMNEGRVLEAMSDLSGPASVAVPYEEVVVAMVNKMLPPDAGKRDARRQHARQSIQNLIDKGAIVSTDGMLSVVNT